MSNKVEAKRYSKAIFQMFAGGTVVGFAVAKGDGTWIATDSNDKRFGFPRPSPKAIARDFIDMAHNTRRDDLVARVKALLATSVVAA